MQQNEWNTVESRKEGERTKLNYIEVSYSEYQTGEERKNKERKKHLELLTLGHVTG